MATGTEARIFDALQAHLAALVLNPALQISWPGREFTPTSEAGYLQASFLPGQTVQMELGPLGINRHVGLLQVDVVWPTDKGLTDPLETVSAIATHFKRGTIITRGEGVDVRIDAPPWPAPALQEPGWMRVPVSIPYFADVANPA